MKKTLLALALAAVCGAASAQSSVTLYGTLDVGYGRATGASEAINDSKGFQQLGNFNNTSNWGLKGTEDLGNGLKANFDLQSAINPENGSSSGFNRSAWAGLSGGFGEVRFGRQFSVADDIITAYDFNGGSNSTSAFNLTGANISGWVNGAGSPISSQAKYISPEWNGLTATLGYATKNDRIVDDGDAAKAFYQAALDYKVGNFSVAGAFESKRAVGFRSAFNVAAKYDFESFAVNALYSRLGHSDDGQAFGVGVAVPLDAFTVGLQAARNTKLSINAYEAFANYAFSKRTSAYVGLAYVQDKNHKLTEYAVGDSALASTYSKNGTVWGIGLVHNF